MRIAIFTATIMLAISSFARAADPAVEDPAETDADFPPGMAEVFIDSHGDRMNGHLYVANGVGPHPTVIMLHGFPGNEKNLDLAQAIRRSGWNVLFFHYRGAWGSDGVFSFSNAINDVASALAFLRDPASETFRGDADRIALIGHSMGGFMALKGGANDSAVQCIAGLAASNLGDRASLALSSPEALEGFKQYANQMRMLNGFSGDSALAELAAAGEAFDLQLAAANLAGKSVFLIGAERDQAVDISVHESLVNAYSNADDIDLTQLRLDADHAFSWHRIRLARELTDWLNQSCR